MLADYTRTKEMSRMNPRCGVQWLEAGEGREGPAWEDAKSLVLDMSVLGALLDIQVEG